MALQRDKVTANAEKLVAKGRIDQAIKEYERLLDDNPNDVNTLNRIGDLWVRVERNDEAVKVYRKIADHYARDGFFLKAIAIFKKINKLDPSKLDIYAKLAELYAKQGLAMEAKSQYMVLADYYLKHTDIPSAIGIYHKIAELDPNAVNVHVKLADLYSQNQQSADALREYERVGRTLLKRSMPTEAMQVFRKALKIESGSVELAESLATTFSEAKDHDNAIQILQAALESNRENPRLIRLLAETEITKGDTSAARTTLEGGLRSNPSDVGLRELLSDVYLQEGSIDRALELIQPLITVAGAPAQGRVAVDLLNRILKNAPSNIVALEKLATAYQRLGEEADAAETSSRLASVHIARTDYESAESILRDLLTREPARPELREKLALVLHRTGRSLGDLNLPESEDRSAAVNEDDFGTIVVEPVDGPAAVSDSPAAQQQGASSEEIEFEFAVADLPSDSTATSDADVEPMPPASTVEVDSDREREEADLAFANERITEADVFVKYGLIDKGLEHLRAALERIPDFLPAYEKLLSIFINEGDAASAASTGDAYMALLRQRGDFQKAEEIERQLAAGGYIDVASAEQVIPLPPETDGEEPPPDVSALELEMPAAIPSEPAPAEFDEVEALDIEEEFDLDIDQFEDLPTPEPSLGEPESALQAESLEPPALEAPPLAPPAPLFEDAELFDVAEPDSSGVAATAPNVEDVGELDFYIEQELFDEATSKLRALMDQFPNDRVLHAREQRLGNSRTRSSAAVSPPPAAALPMGQEDTSRAVVAPPGKPSLPGPPPAIPPVASIPAAVEEDLFSAEDSFFDLAAALESELAEDADEAAAAADEEQSLEQIFREFKKGVEQQLDSEDYDTHYNLGIAYKEMGLIDEAIGEFQLASKDPQRAIDGCSMLGLCFLEKGMPQLAIKWYSKGLENPEITDEEHLGLLYDLGNAYLEVGDTDNAHKAFVEVYGINSKYRDVVSRIKQLEEVRRVQ
jgi:tetratricopeptide (TPR) repeat protein